MSTYYHLTCLHCGKGFSSLTPRRKYCCPACEEDAKKEKAEMKKATAEKNKKKEINTELVRLSVEAREHGMSYGQYVAYLSSRRH